MIRSTTCEGFKALPDTDHDHNDSDNDGHQQYDNNRDYNYHFRGQSTTRYTCSQTIHQVRK